jgi:integrase
MATKRLRRKRVVDAKTGEVRYRQETVWRARVTRPDGRRKERIFETKAKAVAWEQEHRLALSQGYDPDQGKRILRSWFETWSAGRMLSPSARMRDEGFWRNHIEPEFGDWSLSAIRRADVRRWAVALMERRGLSVSTTRRVVGLLAMVLEEAHENELIRSNPARGLKLKAPVALQVKPKRREFLTKDELTTVADEVPERFRAVVLTGGLAGLRFEEITGLRRDRILAPVDLVPSWRIRVDQVIVEVGGRLYPQVPKSKASARDVPIPDDELRVELERHLGEFSQPEPDGLVFTAAKGGPLRRNNFAKRVLGPAAERAIGKWISPHDLRRSYGALLIEAGVNLVAVQALMGHEDIKTTLTHYSALLDGGEVAAIKRFSAFLTGSEPGAESGLRGAQRGLKAAE